MPRISVLIYSTFATFIAIIVSLLLSFNSQDGRSVWEKILTTSFLRVPLLVYVFALSIIVGIITYVLVSLVERRFDQQIEENLRHLVRGEYDETIHFETEESSELSTNYQIHQNIHLLAEKLQQMSEQLQSLTKQQEVVDGETREEILTTERHRLSRELHDSVSQQLFAAMMILSALNETAQTTNTPESYRKQIAVVTDIVNAAQSEMRALLLHLRPIELSGKSLRQGIEQLLRELQTKIKIQLTWEVEDIQLSSFIEDHLFRIVQELLSNTLRHAKADELEVYLRKVNHTVLLRVIDDGVGFDINQEKSASYGLKNIRERVVGMGGTVKIISFKGQGTSIEIKVPIVDNEGDDKEKTKTV
jgi:NarL family two-component system sensor histidine kinase LiaS